MRTNCKYAYLYLKQKVRETRIYLNKTFLDQIRKMQEKLEQEAEGGNYFLRVLYVKKNYRRNGAGTGLLRSLEETEKRNLYVCADREGNLGFL